MPCIYLTINHYNKDRGIYPWKYIGSDQFDRPSYLGSSRALKEDITKLGKECFTKIILEQFEIKPNRELRFAEAVYLKKNNVKKDPTYYNLTDDYAPAGGKKGMKMPPRSESHIQNWVKSRTGKGWTDEQRFRRIAEGNPMYGRKASVETKAKMSEARDGEKNHNSLQWEVTDPDGNTVFITALRKYCRDNNLVYSHLYHSKFGWKTVKHGAGKGGRKKINE